MIRVAIVDDHPAIIAGITNMFQQFDNIEITGGYLSAHAFIESIKTILPDVLLLDIQMPEMTGDKLIQYLRKGEHNTKVLILTNFDSPFYVENMLRYGANGYLLKSSPQEQIVAAIRKVHAGEEYIAPELAAHTSQFATFKKRMVKANLSLTEREKQILQLIADGKTTQNIADELFLSYHTVENYRDNILMKLDVANTAALIKKAVMSGLVR